jgi:uncharacterized protein (DUF1501 family)
MNRRDFIHQLSHSVALPALMSGISWDNLTSSSSSLLGNTLGEGNILIIVLLNGGNDGLNTVIPLNMMSQLNSVRPKVVMPENKLLPLNKSDLALHPSLTGLQSLSKENRLKIVQSVGYPTPNYSHFRSMDIWQSGSTSSEYFSSGWAGRYLEKKHPDFPEAYPTKNYPDPLALEIGWNSSLMFTGQHSFTSVVASNPENFYEIIGDLDLKYPSTPIGEKLKYLQLIAKQSNAYGKVLKESYIKGKDFTFPNTNLGNQFKIISKLISGGTNTRIYKVEIGGFDTHSAQVDTADKTKGAHANLMKELDEAITTFMKSMDSINQSDRIVGMCFSEFGRTIHSNDTYGTDHGAIAPVILFGNKLDPNVAGTNPIIPANVRGQEELDLQFDFKQIYGSLITQWMGGGSDLSTIFSKEYNQISIIKEEFRDADEDGVGDLFDKCPNTPIGTPVDINGCEIFVLPTNNYEIGVSALTCKGTSNGGIKIKVANTTYTYQVTLANNTKTLQSATIENGKNTVSFSNLSADTYTLSIKIDGKANYNQSFECKISEPDVLKVSSSLSDVTKLISLQVEGTETYTVSINGVEKEYTASDLKIPVETGPIHLKVYTKYGCQGTYEQFLFLSENANCFPNPTSDWTKVYVDGADQSVECSLIDSMGKVHFSTEKWIDSSRSIDLNLANYPSGLYLIQLKSSHVQKTLKVIKL